VRLLLDSHVCLWWLEGSASIGPRCRDQVSAADEVFFSAVTPWELGIKRALGRLDMPDGLVGALVTAGFEPLPVTAAHAERAPALPPERRRRLRKMPWPPAKAPPGTGDAADPTRDFEPR